MRITAQSIGRQSYLTYKISAKNSGTTAKSNVNSIMSNLSSSTLGNSSDMNSLASQMSSLKANQGALKSYYSNLSGTQAKNLVTSKSNAATVDKSAGSTAAATTKTAAAALTESAGKLAVNGRKSLFNADSEGKYDMNAIADAVSKFASDYNSLKSAVVDGADSKSVQTEVSMVNSTASNESMLNKIGITIGKDNNLSVDTEKLKNADVADIKSLFNGTGSYGYNVATKANQIEAYATTSRGTVLSGTRTSGSFIDTLV